MYLNAQQREDMEISNYVLLRFHSFFLYRFSLLSVEFLTHRLKTKGEKMASYLLRKESKQILQQMGVAHYDEQFACPLLKILQMRHKDLDIHQAVDVIKDLIDQ